MLTEKKKEEGENRTERQTRPGVVFLVGLDSLRAYIRGSTRNREMATDRVLTAISPKVLSAGLFLLLSVFIVFRADADTLEDQIADISGELMCPVCEGQSVAESNAQLARDMRVVIRAKLLEGKTKEEIIDYFISSYGETILASPPPRGFSAILWLLPILSVLIGAAIILRTIRAYKVEEKNN